MTAHRLLFNDLLARLGWRFPVLVLWTALVGLSEGASIVLLLPLLNRIGIVTAGSQSVANALIERGLALAGARTTGTILLLVGAVATLQMIFSVTLNWWSVRLARSYEARRQIELFGAFMRAKWTFMIDRKAGEMVNAIITECERLGRAFALSLSLFGSAVVALIYVVLSTLIAWQATLILVVFAIAAALAMTRFYKKSYAFGKTLTLLNAQLQAMLEEQFAGAKFIKASVGLDRSIAQLEPLVDRLGDINTFTTAMPSVVRALLEYIALIGLAAILVLTNGFGVAPGNVIIVLALFARLFPRLTTVQAQLYALNANVHAIEALDKLQMAAEAHAERQDGSSQPLKIHKPTVLAVVDVEVRFGERIALDQVNLTLSIPGLLAIVGRSGAGKSTLVHALLGLVELSAGSIRLGHYDLASAPLMAWRRSIGYVPQETILFHASVKDNLKLVNPTASDRDIRTAARRAHALEFIDSLPDGFATIIGDQGVKLSGGQRQRLGIARALLTNPALLIMDEAMSALDTESEVELLRTLEELRKQIGILLVAHRLAAARSADVVCVFENGRIVESGAWNELMARKKRLYTLAEAQSLAKDRSVAAL
ncbi:MAG TPA: ABC transporter ATP-binding protein [Pseudolabrys sp.]|nr:ABC transporter ATP-binding protein [Pseudolabrys sp.]